MIDDDYTVELYTADSTWIKQVYVTDSYEDANEWIDKHPPMNGGYYSISCIEYDNETGEEMSCFPCY